MVNLFVSYRRNDTEVITGRLCDRIKERFGQKSVFFDIDNIPLGTDFRRHIQSTLANCQVLLAIIGDKWLGPQDGAGNRIEEPSDWVRLEIEFALSNKLLLIPVLVGSTEMPSDNELPQSIRHICYLKAARLDTGEDFHHHVDKLIRSVEEHFDLSSKQTQDTLVFRTSKQQTYLRVTEKGLECHMVDDHPSKGGHKWTISRSQASRILKEDDVLVNPDYKPNTGLFNIGDLTDWLYSKRLFPEPEMLVDTLRNLLGNASA